MKRPLRFWLALLFCLSATSLHAQQKIPVLLISGENNHDWEWTHLSLRDMLQESGRFEVDITLKPHETLADRGAISRYKAFVLDYNGKRWGTAAEAGFLHAVESGTGVVIIHAANNAFPGWVEYETCCCLCWRKGTGHGSFHEFDVEVTDRVHPITRSLGHLKAHPDELYHRLVHMHDAQYRVLGRAFSSEASGGTGRHEPMILVSQHGKGRVFHTPLGHVWRGDLASRASHKDPQFQKLVVRGTEWAATGDVNDSPGGAAPRPAAAQEPGQVTSAVSAQEGWDVLFDGTSTDAWQGFKRADFPTQGWVIDGHALKVVSKGGGGDIVTRKMYEDFELELEWKIAAGANSGIIYRVSDTTGTTWQSGPEFQILDDGDLPADSDTASGSLYALYGARNKVVRPVGEYNHARVIACGNRIEHWLNGRKIVDAQLDSADWKERLAKSKFASMPLFGKVRKGRIALQDHGNDVWFRNIRIREIPRKHFARYATARKPLFNGKDMTGWTYHLNADGKLEDVWQVKDGSIVCGGKPAGYIRTQKEYANFILHLDWRFSPVTKEAGNSGVLVRQIEEDKVWPKSIEAQLMSGRAGDFWCIGEFPMTTEESRTRGRNTRHLYPNEFAVGEWNHYEISVIGAEVELRVNGPVLNWATECQEVPGHICLQSEGVEIQFRNIEIIDLDSVNGG